MGRNRALRRRTFLQLTTATAAAAAGSLRHMSRAVAEPAGPFRHGVASGDPRADGILLWSRVTPTDEAAPGSGLGEPTEVGWEIGTDEQLSHTVATGSVLSTAASDHTIRVEVAGLDPDTTYWYRFGAQGQRSPIGRTRTAPAPQAEPTSLRIGVVSCSNWEGGWFSAYRHLADRDDLDFVLHLGDYVYEYGVGGYGPGSTFGRVHEPTTEMTTLEHYRRRHAQYKTDPDLARLHQRYAFVTTIDDHETTDNAWRDGAANHQPSEGEWELRRAEALQAYFEWMPIRATGGSEEPTRVYRGLHFGSLADVFVLDERTYRSRQVDGLRESLIVTSPEVAASDRTLLGADQSRWLAGQMDSSAATWKVLANPVMFAPFMLGDPPDVEGLTPLLDEAIAGLGVAPPIVFNGDQWDGYRAEQRIFNARFAGSGGVVLLTGDVHSSWAAEVPSDPGTYLPVAGGPTTAVEFVTPAVTSDSLSASLASAGVPAIENLAPLLPTIVSTANPWFKHFDGERHGFGVFEVTPDAAQFDWWYVSDRTDRHATLVPGPSFRSPVGSNKLEATTALDPRRRPATGAARPDGTTTTTTTQPPPSGAPRLPATGGVMPLAAAAAAGAVATAGAAVAQRARPESSPEGPS